MSSSRPKRSAAIACTTTMKGINWSEIETEDHQEESPSKKLRNESQQTLEEIIQNVASCKSESDGDPWSQLYQRILERPSEITPRHLLSALQICHPDRNLELPPKLICDILKSDKEMLHFECIRHLTTCPWMPLATIETIFNQEMTQILKDDDFLGNNYASPRFDAFVSNCGKVLELLNFPEEQTPPRLDAVDAILETIGLPIFTSCALVRYALLSVKSHLVIKSIVINSLINKESLIIVLAFDRLVLSYLRADNYYI